MMMDMKEKAMAVAAALEDKKALDIRVLSVENLTSLTDCFVIASAASASQLDAMADAVDEALSKRGEPPQKKRGNSAKRLGAFGSGKCDGASVPSGKEKLLSDGATMG